jgi:hypothetical protein
MTAKIRQSYDKPLARLGEDLFKSKIIDLGGLGIVLLHGLILDLVYTRQGGRHGEARHNT